jgi:predicted phosphoadenosine phosphosulfate sulfurtransferase
MEEIWVFVMPKKYVDKNVYDAAVERTEFIYDNFERVYFSFSAGKDSSVMLHIALDVARKRNKLPVHALFIDLEGQYKTTIEHAEEMMLQDDVKGYWVCLPIHLRNAVSMYHSQWVCWDPSKKDVWIRDLPTNKCVISDVNYFPFFRYAMEFEQFVPRFHDWFSKIDMKSGKIEADFGDINTEDGKKKYESLEKRSTACGVGIRSDESLNRFRTIVNKKKITYDGNGWTTLIAPNLYNFYPVYDWKVEDIWTAVSKFGWKYNHLYDLMYMQGRTLSEMRICQPYGDDQKKGLDLFHECEPETWFRVVTRVSGANMGSIYRMDPLLGYKKVILPKGQTWKSYALLLLESLPRYEAEHYLTKIKVFFDWWAKHGYPLETVPDAADPHLEAAKKIPSWRRIVKCIMKNDRLCKSLSFAQTKFQYSDYQQRHNHYSEDEIRMMDDTSGNDGAEDEEEEES